MDVLCKEFGHVLEEDRILRFYYGSNCHVETTRLNLSKHLLWRQSHPCADVWKELYKSKRSPLRVSHLPHCAVLHENGLGMIQSVLSAGKARFSHDIVHLEVLASAQHNYTERNKDLLDKLTEYYIGFFELRSLRLELLSSTHRSLVRTIQIRDVSHFSSMPSRHALSMVKHVLDMGMDNYKECGSLAIFLNPPRIVDALFVLVSRWLPSEIHNKLKFFSGKTVVPELLRFVHAETVVAYHRLIEGKETGDDIANSFGQCVSDWKKSIVLTAASCSSTFSFVLSRDNTTCIDCYVDGEVDNFSAMLYFVLPGADSPETCQVESMDCIDAGHAVIPNLAVDAVLVLDVCTKKSSPPVVLHLMASSLAKWNSLLYKLKERFPGATTLPSHEILNRFLLAEDSKLELARLRVKEYLDFRSVFGLDKAVHTSKSRRQHLVLDSCHWVHLEVVEPIEKEEVENWLAHYATVLDRNMQSLTFPEQRVVYVWDLANLPKLPTHHDLDLMKRLIALSEKHFPYTCAGHYLLNVPSSLPLYKLGLRSCISTINTPINVLSGPGDVVAKALLKFLLPETIACLSRLQRSLPAENDFSLECFVRAGECEFVYLPMKAYETVMVCRKNPRDSSKSLLWGEVMWLAKEDDVKTLDKTSDVEKVWGRLPQGIPGGLFVVKLDHTKSWVQSHVFALNVSRNF